MITFSKFKKRFKGTGEDVLNIPELVLENNLYWLKGKNGVGKTSLIKSMAGIIPFEGCISINGLDINKHRMQYRLTVNYAEAEPVYPAFLKGTDLVDLYAYTKKATSAQLAALVKKFDISPYLKNKVGSYSSGMAKKLSLLLAFIGKPTLILLDEPFITLDPQASKIVEELIIEYQTFGTGFIIASHQDFLFSDVIHAQSIELINKTILLS